ncbi:eif-2A, partial [Pristionchus pacificus]
SDTTMGENIIYAYRGSTGFGVKRGIKPSEAVFEDKENGKVNPCRVFEWSNTGRFFAYCDSVKTCVIEASTGRVILSAELKRTAELMFSPKDSFFLTWEPYTTYNNKDGEKKSPDPNLRIWNMQTGEHITTLVAQKQSQWRPQFSDDETIAVRLVGSELLVHKNSLFEKYDNKLVLPKMEGFALSPGQNLSVAVYIAAHGGKPAVVQVRRLDKEFSIVVNKTFFKSDSAKFNWNIKGTALLILSAVDVDSSNKSYYGEQTVHLVNVMSGDACKVPLCKNGPVYQAKWNPNGREFAVCYGYMPARVTWYNLRAEVVFNIDEGPRNEIHYNAFGNILLVCGFGNLATGKIEVWDTESRKMLIEIAVPNTTHLEWSPDGQHFMTATTCPRLRIDNCYRLWNYKGRMMNEVAYASPTEELWQVSFRKLPGVYNPFPVRELTKEEKSSAGLLVKGRGGDGAPAVPAGAVTKASAYVPPHLRKEGCSKGALETTATAKPAMTENERKIMNLQKKIVDIEGLKKRQDAGEILQLNQLDKIQKEAELLEQIAALRVN